MKILDIAVLFLATFAGAATTNGLVDNPLPEWAFGGFVRPDGVNPVIRPNATSVFNCPMQKKPVKWEESDTFNPAAIAHDGKIYVLYRAEDNSNTGIGSRTSRIGLAESFDGVSMTRHPAPVLFPGEDNAKEYDWPGGCEDPRLAVTADGLFVMTYTSWNRKVARLSIATSRDLKKWTKHGPAFAKFQNGKYKNNFCKSAAIVTELDPDGNRYVISKINGRYLMYWGESRIYAATSADLVNWDPVETPDGKLRELVRPRSGYFDSDLTEVGPAAIRTKDGILVFYNGKNSNGSTADPRFARGAYCAGQVLFDRNDPLFAVARLDVPFFRPMKDFERTGQYASGTVFIEGLVYFKSRWFLYYGCADSLVGVAVWDPAQPVRLGDPVPSLSGMGDAATPVPAAPQKKVGKLRNLAYRRAVYQSSAADFDHVGHLVTDGLFSEYNEERAVYSSQYQEECPANETPPGAFDGKRDTKWLVFHPKAWLQIQLPHPVCAKGYTISSANDAPLRDPKAWVVQGSNDGKTFTDLDSRVNQTFKNRQESASYQISRPAAYRYYRLNITENNGDVGKDGNTKPRVQLSEFDLTDTDGKSLIRDLRESRFTSVWCSGGSSNEWVYVDLGAESTVTKLRLLWGGKGFAQDYDIQQSSDAQSWQTALQIKDGKGGEEWLEPKKFSARYVRLFCRKTQAERFALSELEIYGKGGAEYHPDTAWRIARADEVAAVGEELSTPGFDDSAWLPAVVPGTALMSYLRAGAIPDPNVADQQLMVSDRYFTTSYWYRYHFGTPKLNPGERFWLCFKAVNWKAEIYLNGKRIGEIAGSFMPGKFDITDRLAAGRENVLAVLVRQNRNPGEVTLQNIDDAGRNGGILGADNPTIHPSIGWDWVPTIRGRNVGIYGEVNFERTGDVTISDAWAVTKPEMDRNTCKQAEVSVRVRISNVSDRTVEAKLGGQVSEAANPQTAIDSAAYAFSQPVKLLPGEIKEVAITPFTMKNPKLWWPNTYGQQPLYRTAITATVDGRDSDHHEFNFGVREFSYDTKKPMTIYCNGVRIICRGGNWGMDDSNLAATTEDYFDKARLHAQANLTMIRNWVGMTSHQAFYDACDRYGILIWDDFWLANPADGPDPDDQTMFMANAREKIYRNRHHAALALYCARNEGDPPSGIKEALPEMIARLDPTRHYIPHSANYTVSGYGPYGVRNPEWYFANTPETLHSERGMPNVPAYENLLRMLTKEHAWPIDNVWGMHDFTNGGAQNARDFKNYISSHYGNCDSLGEFARIAQMVNYENHKAMMEPIYCGRRNGMLMWMSQSAWPSMVWQTYDYYHDTNAGYFGIKKANQPFNVVLDQAKGEFWLSNSTPYDLTGATAYFRVYNIAGGLLHEHSERVNLASDEHRVWTEFPEMCVEGVFLVRAGIANASGTTLCDNFTWWNPSHPLDYRELMKMPQVALDAAAETLATPDTGTFHLRVKVANHADTPALLARLKIIGRDGLLVPAQYSDNYFSLLPGEETVIDIVYRDKTGKVKKPAEGLQLEGWNIKPATL